MPSAPRETPGVSFGPAAQEVSVLPLLFTARWVALSCTPLSSALYLHQQILLSDYLCCFVLFFLE